MTQAMTGHEAEMAAHERAAEIDTLAGTGLYGEWRECSEECRRLGLATLDLLAPCICGALHTRESARAAVEAAIEDAQEEADELSR
jgi:hypothetical protein